MNANKPIQVLLPMAQNGVSRNAPQLQPLTPCGMSLKAGDSRGTGVLFSNMFYSMLFITFYGGILPRVHYKRSPG